MSFCTAYIIVTFRVMVSFRVSIRVRVFNHWVPGRKYSILDVGFPTCRYSLTSNTVKVYFQRS